jgi:hypothetical protein
MAKVVFFSDTTEVVCSAARQTVGSMQYVTTTRTIDKSRFFFI